MNAEDCRKRFKKGDVLLKEGDEGSEFFLLEEGSLDVFIHARKVATISGAHDSQEFIGEVAALLGGPRIATVVAITDCVTLCIPKLQVEAILKNSPSLGVKLMRSICRKLSSMAHLCVEFQDQNASVLQSGNTEASLRNYMKGVLHLMDLAATDSTGEAAKHLGDYFRKTNPWAIQRGEKKMVLDSSSQNPFLEQLQSLETLRG